MAAHSTAWYRAVEAAWSILFAFALAMSGGPCFADTDPYEYRYENIDIASHPKVKGKIECPLGHDSIHVLPRPPSCIVMTDDPTEVWVCSKCYYQYDLKHHYWHRWSRRTEDFAIPLSEFVKLFQIDKKDIYEGLQYDQYVKFGKVQWESAFLRTNLPVEKSREYVKAVLEKHRIQHDVRSETKNGVAYTYFSGKWNGYDFEASVGKQIHWPNPSYIRCEIKGKSIWEIK